MRHLGTSWRLPRHAILRRVLHAFLGLETLLVLGCGNRETADAGGKLAASLEREIGVVEDMTVFTLFAFLNVAGYDLENREAGMHPVRVQIRAALAQDLDPDLRANRFLSVEGPQQRIGYNPHEFVHAVTNPAVYTAATATLRDRLLPVVETAARALGEEERYTSVEAFVDECLVRAISLRYAAAGHPESAADLFAAMLAEYRSGYILERFFWEQLAGYEREDVDLRQYYPQMLATLDAAAELHRWQRETSSDSVEIESTTP